jgi:hypothetical protein
MAVRQLQFHMCPGGFVSSGELILLFLMSCILIGRKDQFRQLGSSESKVGRSPDQTPEQDLAFLIL